MIPHDAGVDARLVLLAAQEGCEMHGAVLQTGLRRHCETKYCADSLKFETNRGSFADTRFVWRRSPAPLKQAENTAFFIFWDTLESMYTSKTRPLCVAQESCATQNSPNAEHKVLYIDMGLSLQNLF